MKHGSIPSSWMGITGVMSAQPHLALLEEVDKRGIDHKDLAAVAAVWKELNEAAETKARELQERHQKREEEASADAKEREKLINTLPGLANRIKKKKI